MQFKISESDDFEDDDVDVEDDDLDLLEEDDLEYTSVKRQKTRRKIGQSSKGSKENKSNEYNRRKRGRAFSDEAESFELDSQEDSDGFSSQKIKRAPQSRDKKIGGRSTTLTAISSPRNEVRHSGRSVRKVSYVESEESEDIDEEKLNKSQKVCINQYFLLSDIFLGFLNYSHATYIMFTLGNEKFIQS